jgi:hypothetical protein
MGVQQYATFVYPLTFTLLVDPIENTDDVGAVLFQNALLVAAAFVKLR